MDSRTVQIQSRQLSICFTCKKKESRWQICDPDPCYRVWAPCSPVLHEISCSFTNLPLLFHVHLHPAPLARMGLSNQLLGISRSTLFLPFASTGSFFFLQVSGCQQRKRSCNSKQKLRYCFLVDPASQQRQAGASICEMALFILSVLLRSQATTQAKLLSPNCMWQEIHIQLIWK